MAEIRDYVFIVFISCMYEDYVHSVVSNDVIIKCCDSIPCWLMSGRKGLIRELLCVQHFPLTCNSQLLLDNYFT